jgi:hypothetical protein
MRKLVWAACVVCSLVVAAAVARSDEGSDVIEPADDPPLPEAEYITGQPIEPVPSSEPPPKDPLKPYDIGEGVTPIPYEALNAAEQAVVDRGRNTAGWQQIHSAYGAAAAELGVRARSEAAARQLGVPDLAMQGVVP